MPESLFLRNACENIFVDFKVRFSRAPNIHEMFGKIFCLPSLILPTPLGLASYTPARPGANNPGVFNSILRKEEKETERNKDNLGDLNKGRREESWMRRTVREE